MSLTKDHGDIVFQCDGKGCREMLETNTSNWDSARNVLTRNKWKPKKDPVTDVWLHLCTVCQKGPLL